LASIGRSICRLGVEHACYDPETNKPIPQTSKMHLLFISTISNIGIYYTESYAFKKFTVFPPYSIPTMPTSPTKPRIGIIAREGFVFGCVRDAIDPVGTGVKRDPATIRLTTLVIVKKAPATAIFLIAVVDLDAVEPIVVIVTVMKPITRRIRIRPYYTHGPRWIFLALVIGVVFDRHLILLS
jgi:hypothetical protein